MKIKYSVNEKGEKVYTLKEKAGNVVNSDAHYKFIKIKSIKESKETDSSD